MGLQEEYNKGKPLKANKQPDYFAYCCLAAVIFITIWLYPGNISNDDNISVKHVFYCGWLTAVSTGIGIVPFLFLNEPEKYLVGIANAVAGGMMVTASTSLAYEGISFNEVSGLYLFYESKRLCHHNA